MIRDVSTRWNSTAEMIRRALQLSPALKILVVKAEHNKPGRGVRLACFKLSSGEWQLLADLSPLLDVLEFFQFKLRLLIMSAGLSLRNNRNIKAEDPPHSSSYSIL